MRHVSLSSRWDRVSLRTKITAVTVALLTLGLIVAGLGTMTVLRSSLTEELDRQLADRVADLALEVGVNLHELESFSEDESSPWNPYYLGAYSVSGELIDDNLGSGGGSGPVIDADAFEDFPFGQRSYATFPGERGAGGWRALMVPIVLVESGEPAVLLVATSTAGMNDTVNRFGAVFLFFALTVVILGGALTRLFVTTTFIPLREVEATAARFADGDYSQRLSGPPPNTEVGRLNRSLNQMLSRIDRAFDDRAAALAQMRRFIGDASHELRTPLVSVRGYAELYRMGALPNDEAVRQAMERIEKEAIRMGELVEDLLQLARLDETRPLDKTRVDLVPITSDAARDAMAADPERTVTVVRLDRLTDLPDEVTDATVPLQRAELAAAARALTPSAVPSETSAPTRPEPVEEIPVEPADAETSRTQVSQTGPIAFANATLARLVSRRGRRPVEEATVATVTGAEASGTSSTGNAIEVLGDENKIRQVVTNLMGNAARFSPAGSAIEIGVGADRDHGYGVVTIADHGPGVPPEIRQKIFQRFWRADTSRARETGGSGLGLAIVQAIVTAHGGLVDVVETPGGGATFRVWLPLAPAEPADVTG